MSKKVRVLMVFAVAIAVMVGSFGSIAQAQDPVTITWFIGIGTGAQPEQREAQEAVVQAFNDSHDDIELEIVIVENNVSVETLATLIATGEAPDIVGPSGFSGANSFRGSWLPLDDLIAADGYDLSQFPEAAVEVYQSEEGLLALPLANYPAMLYYRPAMFDEAGLEYPPATYGEPYILDGEEVEWNTETLREVAMILTVDANGNDATSPDFDPENIVQWGFFNQNASPMRQNATMWGAGELWQDNGDGTVTAVFPDAWREGFKWLYNGMWVDHFIPTGAMEQSDQLGAGNAFQSGNLAMAQSMLWYTCCLVDDTEWNAAALPSYNGEVTARLHADTFRIMKDTEHPEEAFEVLKFLVGEASLDLLAVYGGMPAKPEDRGAFFDNLDERYPQGVNWEVAGDGLNYTDVPHHENWMPNNNKANDRIDAFWTLLQNTPDLDVDAEIDTLLAELQSIFEEAPE